MLQRKRKQSDEESASDNNEAIEEIVFKRSFAHVDGNWPSHVYFSLASKLLLKSYQQAAIQHCSNTYSINSTSIVPLNEMHVSLSRPFTLRSHQIDPFLRNLNSNLQSTKPYIFEVFPEYYLLANDDSSRYFICLPIEDRLLSLAGIVNKVNRTMESFRQPVYYEDPKFHISVASFLPPQHIATLPTTTHTLSDSDIAAASMPGDGEDDDTVIVLDTIECMIGNRCYRASLRGNISFAEVIA